LFADKEAKNEYYENKRIASLKKQIYIFVAFILMALCTIIGGTYAWLTTTEKASQTNNVIAGIFKIDFSDGNTINLTNSEPLSKTAGLSTIPYEFSITNSGTVDARYEVALEENSSTIDKKYIMYSLETNGVWSDPTTLESGLKLVNNTLIKKDNTNTYALKIWLSEDAPNSVQNKSYEARIVVTAIQSNFTNFTDVTPPTITLAGDIDNTIIKGSTYTDPGVTSVTDDSDASISTSNITTSYEYYDGTTTSTVSSIDTNKLGVYYIYYHIKDTSNNEGLRIRTINVINKDTNAPTITLVGDSTINIYQDQEYTELGATATDIEDGTLDVITIGTVNTHLTGAYTIKYLATDKAGNTISTTRIVNVLSKGELTLTPEISDGYNTTSTITINASSTVGTITGYAITTTPDTPTTWIAVDSKNIVKTVTETNNGDYYVFVKDDVGNIVSKKITVTRIDTEGPVCSFASDNYYINVNEMKDIKLRCKDSLSGINTGTITTGLIHTVANILTVTKVSDPTIKDDIYEYIVSISASATAGTSEVKLYDSSIKDKVGNYNKSATTSVTSLDLKLNYEEIDIDLSTKTTDKITYSGDNLGTVTYKSADDSIVTIDNDGNVIAKGIGETTITVTSSNGAKKTIPVKITKTLTATFVKQSTKINYTGSETLTCILTKDNPNSCTIAAPDITASTGYTIVGWSTNKDDTKGILPSKDLVLTTNTTYYSISYQNERINKISYVKQGLGVTSIDKTSDSCTIPKAYNDASQATSCQIITTNINVAAGYTAIGWNTNKDAITALLPANTTLDLTTDVTYYSISKKDAITLTAKWDANGNTLSTTTTSSCTLEAVYNNETQNTSCTVKAPTITGSAYTPNIIGFNNSATATTSILDSGATLTLTTNNTNKTWYAITNSTKKTYTITYVKQGLGVTSIGKTTDSCTIDTVYNGQYAANSCTITSPTITVGSGYTVVGWDTSAASTTASVLPAKEFNINTDITYYAISYKDAITLKALWNANGATLSSSATSSCLLSASYNDTAQATSCTVTAPTITGSANTPNVIGFNNSSSATTSILESGATLTLTASNTNKTWYAITNNNPITYTATYTKQGLGVTGISSTGNSCTIVSTYNGIAQQTSCTVTSPSISVNTGYTAVGWALDSNATSVIVSPGGTLTLTNNNTYYSISYKNEIVLTAKWNANGNTLSSTTDSSCTLGKAYNNNTQATTCNVSAPTITAASGTPTIIGFNTTSSATTNSSDYAYATKQLNLTETNTGKTWYAITSAPSKTYTITFNKNGATSQTNSSGTAVTDASVTRSCTIAATYNGTAQATTCKVTSPTIAASTNTPTVIGYNESASGTTSSWNQTTEKPISADATYYAITTSPAITHTVTYIKQGLGVTAIGRESDSCTIPATYSGTAQATSCVVNLPSIYVADGYTLVGWNANKDATIGLAAGSNIALTSDIPLYAISYKDSVSLQVRLNSNNATLSSTDNKNCVIPKAYNNNPQDTSCTITTPTITGPTETPVVVGYNTSSTATTAIVDSGGTMAITTDSNDETLYAITKSDAKTYNVTYTKGSNVSAIGKTSDSCMIAATYNGVSQATSCDVTTPSITANTGYTSVGFALTSGATTGVSAGSALTLTSTNDGKTYYGNASANDYTISYYSSGSSIGTTAAKYGTVVSLTKASTLGATKTGYTFKGWDTSSAAATIVYTDNQSVTSLVPSGTINLYAVYVDDIAPVCTWSSASPTTTGNTTTLTLSCTDLGVGIPSTALTTSNFTTSNATYGSITSVSAPTTITNGYSYVVTVTGNAVGTFKVSLNANSIADNNSNNNALTTSSDITVNGRTYTATFIKNGTGVTAIGSTSLSCTTTGSNTTCSVSAPAISVSAGYTVVGWNTTSDATTGLAELTMSANTTYYSISYKNEITYTTTFNLNNAGTQTNESGTAVATNVTRSCTIAKAYNSNTQATTCSITSPTLTGSTNTPTAIGYNTNSSATVSSWNVSTAKIVNSNLTYYAITSKDAVTYTANWNANNNTLSTTATSSCTIAPVYNGASQTSSCTVTSPTITASSATPTIIGFNTSSNATTNNSSYSISTKTLTLTSSNTGATWYALTSAPTKTYTAHWDANGATLSSTTDTSCTINATYNGESQATTCAITAPTITAGPVATPIILGFNTTSTATTASLDSGAILTLTNSNNGTTYYAITSKEAITGTCGSLTYDGTSQTLVSGGTGVTYANNTLTNAGSQIVIINANAGYLFSDKTTSKTLTCSINKATPNITLSATSSNIEIKSSSSFTETSNVSGSFTNTNSNSTATTISPTSYTNITENTAETVNITANSVGSSSITVNFIPTDTANYNNSSTIYTANVVDTIKPVWTIKSVTTSSGSTTIDKSGTVTIVFDGTDTSGIVSSSLTSSAINVMIAGTTMTPSTKTLSAATNITNGYEYTLTLSGFTSYGSLSLSINSNTLTDSGSNVNDLYSASTGVTLADITAPSVSVTATHTASWNNKIMNITVNASDNTGVSNYCYSTTGNCTPTSTTNTFSNQTIFTSYGTSSSDNYKTIYACAKDTSGNVSCATTTAYVYIDCTTTSTSYSSYSYGSCSAKCGGGTQSATRTKTYTDSYTGNSCGSTPETTTVSCNSQACCDSTKTISGYGSWGSYSSCSASCGSGYQYRYRTIYYVSGYDSSISCSSGTDTGTASCTGTTCPTTVYLYSYLGGSTKMYDTSNTSNSASAEAVNTYTNNIDYDSASATLSTYTNRTINVTMNGSSYYGNAGFVPYAAYYYTSSTSPANEISDGFSCDYSVNSTFSSASISHTNGSSFNVSTPSSQSKYLSIYVYYYLNPSNRRLWYYNDEKFALNRDSSSTNVQIYDQTGQDNNTAYVWIPSYSTFDKCGGKGTYQFYNTSSSKYLRGEGTTSGVNVSVGSSDTYTKWTVKPWGTNPVWIMLINDPGGDLCADVVGGAKVSRTNVQLHTCNNTGAELWTPAIVQSPY
jgi:uncharacterized repeat protein (TIGR02543 family)